MTLMIWTHLTTLDEEIRYIWNKETRVTLNKILFGIVRYFATIMFGCVFESAFDGFLAHTTVAFTALVSGKPMPVSSTQSDCGLALFLARPSFEVSPTSSRNVDDNPHTIAGVSQ